VSGVVGTLPGQFTFDGTSACGAAIGDKHGPLSPTHRRLVRIVTLRDASAVREHDKSSKCGCYRRRVGDD
jgi:hypothetical protein